MTILVAELYGALKSAGAKEQEARKAAEAVAQRGGISRDWQERTDELLNGIETKLAGIEARLSTIEAKLARNIDIYKFIFKSRLWALDSRVKSDTVLI